MKDGATLGQYTFKEGDTLVCNTRAVHMDPEVYDDPETFRPDRFLRTSVESLTTFGGEAVNKKPQPFLAFGGGVSQVSQPNLGSSYARGMT